MGLQVEFETIWSDSIAGEIEPDTNPHMPKMPRALKGVVARALLVRPAPFEACTRTINLEAKGWWAG